MYVTPVDFGNYRKEKNFGRHTLGHQVERVRPDRFLSGKRAKPGVALLGVPSEGGILNKGTAKAPGFIRKYLYGLSPVEGSLEICDLGDLRPGRGKKDRQYALRDLVETLIDKGIVPVILGGGQDLSVGICRAFGHTGDFTLSVVDGRVDLKAGREATSPANFLSAVLRENPALYHLEVIGTQAPQVAPRFREELRQAGHALFPLGRLREDIAGLEPLLRDTVFLSFDMSAVKQSDAPGHCSPGPNGLYAEEACQIARYAGLGTRMQVFGLFEVNPRHDKEGITSQLAAQMVWYFLEAFAFRRQEDPRTGKEAFTQYFVEMAAHGERIVFYHHPPTNRWWIEIEDRGGKGRIAACRERDYQEAVRQEIPEIWWKYARKSGSD